MVHVDREKKVNGEEQQYSPWENYWMKFGAHETPGSLRLANDFISTLNQGGKVLEVGCASGRVLRHLRTVKQVEAVGVDINNAEIAGAKGQEHNQGIEFHVMNGARLKFPDNSFDNVVMTGVIGGVEPNKRSRILKEAYRVVKPGGTVAVAEFKVNKDDPEKRRKYEEAEAVTGEDGTRIIKKGKVILFYAKHFTEDELIDLFDQAGFLSIQTRGESIESAGIGDGILEARRQYTVWGTKPTAEESLL